MIRRTPPPLSALWKYSEKSPKIYVRPIIFPCLSRREITGRLHRPTIIYIDEHPGFLPAFLHSSRPDIFLYKFWPVALTTGVSLVLPVMKIRWAPSRGYISHRCTQIIQGELQQVSHSQIKIYYCLTNSTLSQKKGTPRWQGLYRTALTPFQIWWDWSRDFSLYVLFLDGATQYTFKYIYIAASFSLSKPGNRGGSPLSEYLRFYLL